MNEPSQADIDRLADMLEANPEWCEGPTVLARRLLEAGVQLPPEPEPAWRYRGRGDERLQHEVRHANHPGAVYFPSAWPAAAVQAVVDALNAAEPPV